MPFIFKQDVCDGYPVLAHHADDLIAFGLLDAWIVRALRHEERDANLARLEQRRLRIQERAFAHALRERRPHRLPVRRDRGEQRVEIRRSDDVDAAGESYGRERQCGEHRVSTVTAAHDREARRIRVALRDRPIARVEQVGAHRAGPLEIARVQKRFAIAGRTAKVHLQHGISTIREPLRPRIEAPAVAMPGTAVNEHDGRQSPRFDAGGKREISVNLETVASGEDDRTHRRQHASEKCRTRIEKERA